jgi:putative NIF3 family GTP cyclohydrolase 1 type 2
VRTTLSEAPHPVNRQSGYVLAAMADRDEIVAWADDYPDLAAYPDYGPMGLQVVAASDVRKLVCGVSASREHFKRAAEAGEQIVLPPRALLREDSPRIGVVMPERPRALLDAGRLTRTTGIKHFQR